MFHQRVILLVSIASLGHVASTPCSCVSQRRDVNPRQSNRSDNKLARFAPKQSLEKQLNATAYFSALKLAVYNIDVSFLILSMPN